MQSIIRGGDNVHHTGLFTVGVFALIFDPEGKLLLKRRPEDISLPGDWDLSGGGVSSILPANLLQFGEVYFVEECVREVEEETGMEVLPHNPRGGRAGFYPFLAQDRENPRHLGDIALTIPMRAIASPTEPTKGEWGWFSPEELTELANQEVGNRLVSGFGKRMWRMCVDAFRDHSPSGMYRTQARHFPLE